MGGKALLYDLASKIPCIIHDPRLPDRLQGRQVDHLVSRSLSEKSTKTTNTRSRELFDVDRTSLLFL